MRRVCCAAGSHNSLRTWPSTALFRDKLGATATATATTATTTTRRGVEVSGGRGAKHKLGNMQHGNFGNYIVIRNCKFPKCSKVQSNFAAATATAKTTATTARGTTTATRQQQQQQQHTRHSSPGDRCLRLRCAANSNCFVCKKISLAPAAIARPKAAAATRQQQQQQQQRRLSQ